MSESENQKYSNASANMVSNGKVGQGVPNANLNNIKEQSKPLGILAGFFGGIGGGGPASNGGNGGNGGNGDDDDFDPDEYRHEPEFGDIFTLAYI